MALAKHRLVVYCGRYLPCSALL